MSLFLVEGCIARNMPPRMPRSPVELQPERSVMGFVFSAGVGILQKQTGRCAGLILTRPTPRY